MVQAISELEVSQAELDEYVETLDEDLADIESEIYGEFDDEENEEEPLYIEVECPNCHETVYFDEELFDSEEDLVCPNCHETIYMDEENLDVQDDEYKLDDRK